MPELSVDLKVEDIGFIWKVDDKGKVHMYKFQVHFHSLQKRNELFNKRFLLGKHRQIFVDLDLTYLQRQKNKEVLSKLAEVNKCRCKNGKLPMKDFRCGKHLKLNKLDFDINQNFEAFIIYFGYEKTWLVGSFPLLVFPLSYLILILVTDLNKTNTIKSSR